jgi:hypothetical protein
MRAIAILAVCALAGCATQSQQSSIAALEVGLASAETAATAYATLPRCPAAANPCSDPATVAKIKVADSAAYASLKAAEMVGRIWRTGEPHRLGRRPHGPSENHPDHPERAIGAPMSTATIIAIVQALLALAPKIPEIIQGVETAIGLLESGAAPTTEQQAQIDALLERCHAELQAAAGD